MLDNFGTTGHIKYHQTFLRCGAPARLHKRAIIDSGNLQTARLSFKNWVARLKNPANRTVIGAVERRHCAFALVRTKTGDLELHYRLRTLDRTPVIRLTFQPRGGDFGENAYIIHPDKSIVFSGSISQSLEKVAFVRIIADAGKIFVPKKAIPVMPARMTVQVRGRHRSSVSFILQ